MDRLHLQENNVQYLSHCPYQHRYSILWYVQGSEWILVDVAQPTNRAKLEIDRAKHVHASCQAYFTTKASDRWARLESVDV